MNETIIVNDERLRRLIDTAPVTMSITGESMGPLLAGRRVTVARCRWYLPGDIVIFRRHTELVAHRLMGYRLGPKGVRMLLKGDTACQYDAPTRPRDAIGVVVRIDEDLYSPTARQRATCLLRSVQYFLFAVRRRATRMRRVGRRWLSTFARSIFLRPV